MELNHATKGGLFDDSVNGQRRLRSDRSLIWAFTVRIRHEGTFLHGLKQLLWRYIDVKSYFRSQREKTYPWTCAPTTTQIILRIRVAWSEFFFVHVKKFWILGYPNCARWRFWSACENAQADLKLRWMHAWWYVFWRTLRHLYGDLSFEQGQQVKLAHLRMQPRSQKLSISPLKISKYGFDLSEQNRKKKNNKKNRQTASVY